MAHAYTATVTAETDAGVAEMLDAYDTAVHALDLRMVDVHLHPGGGEEPDRYWTVDEAADAVVEPGPDREPVMRYTDGVTTVTLGPLRQDDRYRVDVHADEAGRSGEARDVVEQAFSVEMREPRVTDGLADIAQHVYKRVRG